MDQKLLQIRRSHASARPTSRNPAWLHTHNDLTYVLALLDSERERCAMVCDEAAERLRNSGCKHEAAAVESVAEDLRA